MAKNNESAELRDVKAYPRKKVQNYCEIRLRVTPELYTAIQEQAKINRITTNNFIIITLSKGV
jgi:predicted HicB family RNase H-like nuclease